MKIEIRTGELPTKEGLYLVFVECAVPRGWCEPHIVLWNNGRWMHRNSSLPYLDQVHGWAQIPVVKTSDLWEKLTKNSPEPESEPMRYDL
jgi:hypothetical protein